MKRSNPCRPAFGSKPPAFTLIEILVVVAIIALLTAILLPSLSRARAQAKIAACNANLHQIGTGCLMYAQCNLNYYPLTASNGSNNWFALWKAKFLPNVGSLICPATRNVIRPETLKWKVDYTTGPARDKVAYFTDPGGSGKSGDICSIARNRDDSSGGHSYEYTACYRGGTNDPYRPLAGGHRRTTHFQSFQSEIALAWDADESQSSQPSPSMGCVPSLGNNGGDCPQPWDNHGEAGTNFLFGDGHSVWVKKVGGNWIDKTAGSVNAAYSWGDPGSPKTSTSVLIDKISSRSGEPWYYYRQ